MPRAYLSVNDANGQISLHLPSGAPLQLSREESCALLRELAWAVETGYAIEQERHEAHDHALKKLKRTYGGLK